MDSEQYFSHMKKLRKKYGDFFSISTREGIVSGQNFFDRKNRNIVRYSIKDNSTETYSLDDLKEKARDILKEKGFKIERNTTPSFISSAVHHNRHKFIDKVNDKDLSKSLYRNGLIEYDEMTEEEWNIIDSIPQSEMLDILIPDLDNSTRFDMWMEILYKNPIEIQLVTLDQIVSD